MNRFFSSITLLLILLTLGVGCADGQNQEPTPSANTNNTSAQSVLDFNRHGVHYDYYDGQIQISGQYYHADEVGPRGYCFVPDAESGEKLPGGRMDICFWNQGESSDMLPIDDPASCNRMWSKRATIVIDGYAKFTVLGTEHPGNMSTLVGVVSKDEPACSQRQ